MGENKLPDNILESVAHLSRCVFPREIAHEEIESVHEGASHWRMEHNMSRCYQRIHFSIQKVIHSQNFMTFEFESIVVWLRILIRRPLLQGI